MLGINCYPSLRKDTVYGPDPWVTLRTRLLRQDGFPVRSAAHDDQSFEGVAGVAGEVPDPFSSFRYFARNCSTRR